ncbi:MAG: AAA family ATPase, partial [Candidatus Omnitrophica bacterium]|nr:AAA family ATPase [Candidatus Omnitrophota bacterium]
MHLKELEIFGFKSFPEKTSLKFEPGITVVVGPNGCGKSNVLDSLKWALGEQSPKSLRGSKMEDIIFNGTEHHPSLSVAEVSLTFTNEDKYLPIDYQEVSITRKLYRSGESEYYINKNIVRLKDIEELFMGTGIGESTYSFVEQGKIEIFLSYKPEDKRLIFDEASGIVKYKERKREAMRRLEETDENLVRLDDIITEVKRQTRYLERQVEKARKFRETQDELVAVEKKIATIQSKELQEKIDKLLEELNVLTVQEEAKTKELNSAKEQWEAVNTALRDLRSSLEAVNQAFITIGGKITTAQNNIKFYEQMIVELKERNVTIELAEGELRQRLSLQEGRVSQEKVHLDSIDENVEVLTREVAAVTQEKETLKTQSVEAGRQIEQEKIKILELENKKANLNNSLIEVQTNLSSLTNRKKRLLLDKARLEGFLSEGKNTLALKEQALFDVEAKLKALKDRKNALALREKELSVNKEDLKNKLVEKEKELVELTSYYEFLKDLHTKYETFSVKKKITVIFDEEPKNINKLVASLRDATFSREGNCYKATVEAKVISLGENQLEEKMQAVRAAIEEVKNMLLTLDKQKEQISQEVLVEDGQIDQTQRQQQEALQEKENLAREWARLNEEYALVKSEMETALTDMNALEATRKNLEEETVVSDTALYQSQESLKDSQGLMAHNSERIKNIDIDVAKKEALRESLHKEKESLRSKINLLEEEKGTIAKNLETIAKEKDDNNVRIGTLGQDIEKVTADIGILHDRIKEQTAKKEVAEKEVVTKDEALEAAKKLEQSLEKECQDARSAAYNKKLDIQSFEYEKGKVKDYIKQVYNIEFEPVSLEGETLTLDAFCAEKDKLKKRIEGLGEVNLVAIEEFEELK